jgi:hypothetical protein
MYKNAKKVLLRLKSMYEKLNKGIDLSETSVNIFNRNAVRGAKIKKPIQRNNIRKVKINIGGKKNKIINREDLSEDDEDYPYINRRYDKKAYKDLENIVALRQHGIKYNPKTISEESAKKWLKSQRGKKDWNVTGEDLDHDKRTPDNIIIYDDQNRKRIIDGYEIDSGYKKRFEQNVLNNYPNGDFKYRRDPNFEYYRDFYNKPYNEIQRYDRDAAKWLKEDKKENNNIYSNNTMENIGVIVKNVLKNVQWKIQLEDKYDNQSVLQTYGAIRAKIHEPYTFEMFKNINFDKDKIFNMFMDIYKDVYKNNLKKRKEKIMLNKSDPYAKHRKWEEMNY